MNEGYPRDNGNIDDVTNAHLLIEGVKGFTELYGSLPKESLQAEYTRIWGNFSLSMSREGQDRMQALSNILKMIHDCSGSDIKALQID